MASRNSYGVSDMGEDREPVRVTLEFGPPVDAEDLQDAFEERAEAMSSAVEQQNTE